MHGGQNGGSYITSNISQNNNNAFSDISSMQDEHFKISAKINKDLNRNDVMQTANR